MVLLGQFMAWPTILFAADVKVVDCHLESYNVASFSRIHVYREGIGTSIEVFYTSHAEESGAGKTKFYDKNLKEIPESTIANLPRQAPLRIKYQDVNSSNFALSVQATDYVER
jgi:hypothetical protein